MKQPIQLLLILLALLLTGCVAPVPAADGTGAEPAAPPEETRTVVHALGETEITGTPARVVALEWSYLEDLLALGVQPVGAADIAGYESWVDIPVALDDSVVDVGTRQEPSLEKLAELSPDLIIAPAFRVAETYEYLSEIAPTLAFDAYPTDESSTQYETMIQTFETIASVVGREAEGQAVLDDLDEYYAAAQAQLAEAGMAGEPFVLAQAFGDDTVSIRLFTDNALAVEIVEKIGLENDWADEAFQQYGFTTVGVETLPELGDLNFLYVVQDDNNVFTRDALQPLWESLAFVENDNAFPLGGETWLFGGPLSAKTLVDSVVGLLTGEPVTATHIEYESRRQTHEIHRTPGN